MLEKFSEDANEVTIDGVTYASKKDCCDTLGISYDTVMKHAKRIDISFEEAVHDVHNKASKHFIVKGVDYGTRVEFCRKTKVPSVAISRYVKSEGITPEEAAEMYLDIQGFKYHDTWYRSKTSCCRTLGVSEAMVNAFISQYHFSPQLALDYALENCSDKQTGPMVYHGILYANLTKCCDAIGISYTHVYGVMTAKGLSRQEAIDFVISNPVEASFDFMGTSYSSYTNCCEVLGIPQSTLMRYQTKYGDSRKQSIMRYIYKFPDKFQDILNKSQS
jgi:hypothetical protein